MQTTALDENPENLPALADKTVLLADDDPAILGWLEIRCRKLGLRVETASDGLRTLLKIVKEAPDLLILDLQMPDVGGLQVCERLKDPKFAPLPVIMLTGQSDEATISRCEALGAFYVFKGPRTWEELEPLIYRVFRERASAPAVPNPTATKTVRVLLVDDDPIVLKSLVFGLQKYGIETIVASNGMQGFWLALKEQPDVIFTDYHMTEGDGHYLLARIKSTPSTQHIPVIVFSGRALTAGERSCIQRDLRGRGQAAAFLTKPINTSTLLDELRRHIRLPVQS